MSILASSRGHSPRGLHLLQGSKHVQGASTITQQVARNFLLNNERTFDRRFGNPAERAASKALIRRKRSSELYLNEIYLGSAITALRRRRLNYFGKSVQE